MNATQTRAKMMPPVWIKSEDSRVSACQVRGVSHKDGASSREGRNQKAEHREGCQLCWGGTQNCRRARLNKTVRESLLGQHQPGGLGVSVGEGESN